MKYIIIREADGAEFPHFAVAPFTHLELLLSQQAHRPGRTAVSAGFCTIFCGVIKGIAVDVKTFGRSESLNLESRPADADLIRVFLEATLQTAVTNLVPLAPK